MMVRLRPPGPDDFRDAVALIQAAANHDELGALTVLRHGRPGAIALALSIIGRDLIGELCEHFGEPRDVAMARLREITEDE